MKLIQRLGVAVGSATITCFWHFQAPEHLNVQEEL